MVGSSMMNVLIKQPLSRTLPLSVPRFHDLAKPVDDRIEGSNEDADRKRRGGLGTVDDNEHFIAVCRREIQGARQRFRESLRLGRTDHQCVHIRIVAVVAVPEG